MDMITNVAAHLGTAKANMGSMQGHLASVKGKRRIRVRIKVRVMARKCFFSTEKISMAPAQG